MARASRSNRNVTPRPAGRSLVASDDRPIVECTKTASRPIDDILTPQPFRQTGRPAPTQGQGLMAAETVAIGARPAPTFDGITSVELARVQSVIFMLVFVVLSQRFGIWVGSLPLSFALMVLPPVLFALMVRGVLLVDKLMAALFFAYAFVLILSWTINLGAPFVKPTPIPVQLVLTGTLCLCAPLGPKATVLLYDKLKLVFLVFAGLAIVQYFAQFVIPGEYLFSFAWLVPERFLVDVNYNILNPLSYEATTFKANGFFFLEASIAGQFFARGFIFMVTYFTTTLGTLVMFVSVLIAYAGTGIMILGIWFTVFILQPIRGVTIQSKIVFGAVAAIGVVLLFTFADDLGIESMTSRATEFQSDESSGYARFIAPTQALVTSFVAGDFDRAFLGLGPGSGDSFETAIIVPYPLVTLVFEYGLLGAVLYVAMIVRAFSRTFDSPAVRAALVLQMLVVDPSFNVPQTTYISMLIGALALTTRPAREPST